MTMQQTFPFKGQGRFWITLSLFFVAFLWLLGDVIAPFLTGLVLAYLLDPVVTAMTRYRVPRSAASGIVLVSFFVVVIGVVLFISPIIAHQAVDFFHDMPEYTARLRDLLTPYLERIMSQLSPEDVKKIQDAASTHVGTVLQGAQKIVMRVWSGGMAVIDVVTFVVITPVVAFYCIRDWTLIKTKIRNLFPRSSAQTMQELLNEFDIRLSGFLRGQMLVCLCLGVFYGVALSLVGLKFGLAIGTITGVLSFIPYVGSTIGLVSSVGVAMVQGQDYTLAATVLAIFVSGQMIEGNFLTPKLVGERVGLHPVWVIFALMAGGNLLGMTGMLLAVPVAAMLAVIIRFTIFWYQKSPAYLGELSAVTDEKA